MHVLVQLPLSRCWTHAPACHTSTSMILKSSRDARQGDPNVPHSPLLPCSSSCSAAQQGNAPYAASQQRKVDDCSLHAQAALTHAQRLQSPRAPSQTMPSRAGRTWSRCSAKWPVPPRAMQSGVAYWKKSFFTWCVARHGHMRRWGCGAQCTWGATQHRHV